MARRADLGAPYFAVVNLVAFYLRWGRYMRGRLLRDGFDLDALDDGWAVLDVIESSAIDMLATNVVQVLAAKTPEGTPTPDWPGWFAHIAEPPLIMCEVGVVQLGAGLAASTVETWGIDLDEFDEPEPAPLRVVLPDQAG